MLWSVETVNAQPTTNITMANGTVVNYSKLTQQIIARITQDLSKTNGNLKSVIQLEKMNHPSLNFNTINNTVKALQNSSSSLATAYSISSPGRFHAHVISLGDMLNAMLTGATIGAEVADGPGIIVGAQIASVGCALGLFCKG